MNQQENSLIVKSNRLIEASYRLTMVEQQLVLMAAAQSRETAFGLRPDKSITIHALDFAKEFGVDPKIVYSQLKEALMTLFHRMMVLHDIDPETGFDRVNHIRWISKFSYVDGAGNAQIIFAPDVIPHINTWFEGNFTKYRLQEIGKFSSVYAVRMYELMVSRKGLGTRRFAVDELREMFGLVDEYPLFANLKSKVIDVAIQQINDFSNLKVSYKVSKTGRKITHLDFSIKEKNATNSKRAKLTKEFIDKHARPGETYEQAADRLRKERDNN